jgi:hypothetical protein
LIVFIQDAHRAVHLRGLTFDRQLVVLQLGSYAKSRFEQPQILVEGTEKGLDPTGNLYRASHQNEAA